MKRKRISFSLFSFLMGLGFCFVGLFSSPASADTQVSTVGKYFEIAFLIGIVLLILAMVLFVWSIIESK